MDVSEMASMGGKARWKGSTKKERSDNAKRMVEAREKKKKDRLAKAKR